MSTGSRASAVVHGRAVRRALFTLSAVAASTAALAQAAPPPTALSTRPMAQPAPTPVFAVRGFQVSGENPLSAADTTATLAPFVRPDATIQILQKATEALEAAFRARGYGLHKVALPPQDVGEIVRLNVVKFAIGRVGIEGASIYDAGNVRRAVPELQEGQSPNFRRLAVQTAIANENPNKQIQVGLREAGQPDQIDATITVKEQRPWTFAAGISNSGTKESGRDRFTVTAGHTNVFNLDHQASLAYTTSLEKLGDVKQLGLSYRVPLYAAGGVIGATYTSSDVVGNFGTFSSTGAGHTVGVSYTKYLLPSGGRRSYLNFGFDDKFFKATEISGIAVGVDRRSRPVTIGYAARIESDLSVLAYNIDAAMNTGSGAGNTLAAYQQEDPRIETVHFKVLRGGVSYLAPLGAWQWTARGAYQYSPDVLISGEQFGLGGVGSVRGTSFDRPITGDKGVSGTFEIATPEYVPGLRAVGFLDAGWLGNNKPNGANKPSTDRLASLGLGLRYAREPFVLGMDYGRIVAGSRVPLSLNSAAPRKGDDRFYVNMSVRF